MATKTSAKKTTKAQNPAAPFYAVVGATDLAVERAREARATADKNVAEARAEFDKNLETARTELAPANVQKRVGVVIEDVKALPTKALNQGVATVDEVTKGYEDLATRGEKLIKRIKNQKATKDLVEQVETTMALGKGAVTTARKAVEDVRSSALATFTTGRHQTEQVAETIQTSVAKTVDATVDAAQDNAEVVEAEVKEAAKRTRTAAKRTNTTATKAAKRTQSSAKATTTSARKAAATSTKATKKAAEKVGD